MKKLFTILLLSSFLKINAQAFYQNALVLDANAGIEVYNTKAYIHYNTINRDTTDEDKAANTHFTFGAEYGLHKNFGLGLRLKTDDYFVGKDSTGKSEGTFKGTEFVMQLNYHPLEKENFDLVLGADVGYSKINYNLNDKDKTHIYASGSFLSMYVNPRLYLGKFGFNAKLYTPFFNYPKLNSNNANFNKDQSFRLSGIPGFGFNIGIQYRFTSPKNKVTKKREEKKEEVKK